MAINVNENGVIKDLSSIKITGFDISSIEYVGEMVETVGNNPLNDQPKITLDLPDLFENYKAFIFIYNGQTNYTNQWSHVGVMVAIVSAMIDRFNSGQGNTKNKYYIGEQLGTSGTTYTSILRSSMGTNTIQFCDGTNYAKYKVYAVR